MSARHAVRLLHRLGASEAGKNLFIGRGDLIGRLVAIHRGARRPTLPLSMPVSVV